MAFVNPEKEIEEAMRISRISASSRKFNIQYDTVVNKTTALLHCYELFLRVIAVTIL